MAYEIELDISGEKKKFVRNEPPMLREMTKALIVQQQQLKMYSKDDGPTEDDFNKNEKNLANFAVSFWKNQFKADQFIAGCDKNNMDILNSAIADSLGGGNEDSPKKSQSKTSTKQ
jgi:hypothetical protein